MTEPTSEENNATFQELFEQEYRYQEPQTGEIRQATIIEIRPDEIIVDLGTKRDGIIPRRDLQRLGKEELAQLRVGDEIPVYILKPADTNGELLVSLSKGLEQQDWDRAHEMLDSGEIVTCKVVGHNKGGILVEFGRLRGFVPNSHLLGFSRSQSRADQQAFKSGLVGQEIVLKVIEVDQERRRLVLSQRAAQRIWRRQQKERLMAELHEGEIRRGRVSGLAKFGAFVDLGGADGLIHISELDWQHVEDPSEVLQVGDEIDVYILSLDREQGRIGLSRKRLLPDPWTLVAEKYKEGDLVEGVVTNLADFGAFVQLDEGVEGLIHITEIASPPPEDPRAVLRPGDRVLVRIVRIEAERQRIGLSLRQVSKREQIEWLAQQAMKKEEEKAVAEEAPPAPAPPAEEAEEMAMSEEPVAAAVEELAPEVPTPAAEEKEGEGEPKESGAAVVEEPAPEVPTPAAEEGEPGKAVPGPAGEAEGEVTMKTSEATSEGALEGEDEAKAFVEEPIEVMGENPAETEGASSGAETEAGPAPEEAQ